MEPREIEAIAAQVALLVGAAGKRWITTVEAARYSGIGRKRLKRLAHAGDIVGGEDPEDQRGTWIFDKVSIDTYRTRTIGSAQNLQETVAANMKRMGQIQ